MSGNLGALALSVAVDAHSGHVDKGGQPYVEHVLAVALAVLHLGENYYATGLLHDVIEDTSMTADVLRQIGIPDEVVVAVEAITLRCGETRDEYYARVRENPIALAVKLADVRHNAQEQRLALLPRETAGRLRHKYQHALAALGEGGR
jgi:(p)ppGpp synthase/HD superfamily hydrolase